MKRVVMFSGGITSWGAARRVAAQHGTDDLVLLFADTKEEHETVYRFLFDAWHDVGGRLEMIADGRNIWEVFRDVRFIGNTRIDPCSSILKRKLMRSWLEQNCDPQETVCYVGFDWDEQHRVDKAWGRWAPWPVHAPMVSEPHVWKDDLIEEARSLGMSIPLMYDLGGFSHANCSGFCVKMGHAQAKRLLQTLPEVYKRHEDEEEKTRRFLGKDVAILRDRRGGTVKPLTLKAFRSRVESAPVLSLENLVGQVDESACSCMDVLDEQT